MENELKERMQRMKSVRRAIRDGYTWPGAYELFGICEDGGCLCPDCMKSEHFQIAWDILHGWKTGWNVQAIEGTCNVDGGLHCDHCGKWMSACYETAEEAEKELAQ